MTPEIRTALFICFVIAVALFVCWKFAKYGMYHNNVFLVLDDTKVNLSRVFLDTTGQQLRLHTKDFSYSFFDYVDSITDYPQHYFSYYKENDGKSVMEIHLLDAITSGESSKKDNSGAGTLRLRSKGYYYLVRIVGNSVQCCYIQKAP